MEVIRKIFFSAFGNVGGDAGGDFVTRRGRLGVFRVAAVEHALEAVVVAAVGAFLGNQGLQVRAIRVGPAAPSVVAPFVTMSPSFSAGAGVGGILYSMLCNFFGWEGGSLTPLPYHMQ